MTREENEKRLAYLKNIVLNMPGKPGSYQFYDENRTIIYVGKAKNLKTVSLPTSIPRWIDSRPKYLFQRYETSPIP